MVDLSGSILVSIDAVRKAVRALASTVEFGPGTNRLALITFGDEATVQFEFAGESFLQVDALLSSGLEAPRGFPGTAIGTGLQAAHALIASRSTPDRPSAVVVLSDGATLESPVVFEARRADLLASDVPVHAIGIGVEIAVVQMIVSGGGQATLLPSFSAVDLYARDLIRSILQCAGSCDRTATSPSTPASSTLAPARCDLQLDLLIMVDVSGSTLRFQETEQELLPLLLGALHIGGPAAVRVGLGGFAHGYSAEAPIGAFTTAETLASAAAGLRPIGFPGTDLAAGLVAALRLLNGTARDAVVLFIVDEAMISPAVSDARSAIIDTGATLTMIGYERSSALLELASTPMDAFYPHGPGSVLLPQTVVDSVLDRLCKRYGDGSGESGESGESGDDFDDDASDVGSLDFLLRYESSDLGGFRFPTARIPDATLYRLDLARGQALCEARCLIDDACAGLFLDLDTSICAGLATIGSLADRPKPSKATTRSFVRLQSPCRDFDVLIADLKVGSVEPCAALLGVHSCDAHLGAALADAASYSIGEDVQQQLLGWNPAGSLIADVCCASCTAQITTTIAATLATTTPGDEDSGEDSGDDGACINPKCAGACDDATPQPLTCAIQGNADDKVCYCAPDCRFFGDCCEDYRLACETTTTTATTTTTLGQPRVTFAACTTSDSELTFELGVSFGNPAAAYTLTVRVRDASTGSLVGRWSTKAAIGPVDGRVARPASSAIGPFAFVARLKHANGTLLSKTRCEAP